MLKPNIGYNKLKLEEKKRICETWQASGETLASFCSTHGLPVINLRRWCKKLLPHALNSQNVSSHSKYSIERKKHFCNAWEKSGLSKSQFRKQQGLPSSFFGWFDKGSTAGDWSPLVIKPEPILKHQRTIPIAIQLANGLSINLALDLPELKNLLGELIHAAAIVR